MTTLLVAVGGAALLLTVLFALIIRRERRRSRLGHAFGPENKGLADIREARRTAGTVREAGGVRPPRRR